MTTEDGQARSAAEEIHRTARRLGVNVAGWQAKLLADAAVTSFDDIVHSRQVADRHLWEAAGFQDHLRERMRRALLDLITKQGLVPVSLPREAVRYMSGGFLDPQSEHEVPESADWQSVVVTLGCPVRIPPVDREAAVKAGILTG